MRCTFWSGMNTTGEVLLSSVFPEIHDARRERAAVGPDSGLKAILDSLNPLRHPRVKTSGTAKVLGSAGNGDEFNGHRCFGSACDAALLLHTAW